MSQADILDYMKKNKGVEFSIRDIVNVFGLCEASVGRCLKKLCMGRFIFRRELSDRSVRYFYV